MSMFGFPVRWDVNALEATQVRLFPASKHRSERIRKKLIKRFGGEFKMQPCIWKIETRFGPQIIAHPSFRAEFERHFPHPPSETGIGKEQER